MWKRKNSRNIIIVSLGVFLSLIAAGLVNILTGQLHLSLILVLIFLTLTAVAWISVGVYDRRHAETTPQMEKPNQEQEEKNRQRLLERVHDRWIKGVLNQSLYHEARLELGLGEYPEALADPFYLSLHHQGQSTRDLPSGTPITQVYDEAMGELLILGEPGSGKTTMLLELTNKLLQRAVQDETHPLPILFNLSSWAATQQPLSNWLVEELNLKYLVPRSLGNIWVNNDMILPLLDGLDEVAITYRAACIETINTYRHDHGSTPTVLCSRTPDFFAQPARLQLQYAVEVKPLLEQQVNDFLNTLGERVAPIQKSLQDDAILRELVSTPLMLSILILAYQGQTTKARTLPNTLEGQRQEIFKTYVQRMLARHHIETSYSPQQVTHWLRWLARQMAHRGQSEFYLEELQPDWLPRVQAFQLSSALLMGLIVALMSGSIFKYTSELAINPRARPIYELVFRFINESTARQLFGSFMGLIFGLITGLIVYPKKSIQPVEILFWSWAKFSKNLHTTLLAGLLTVLLTGLFYGLLAGLFFGLLTVLLLGPIIGLLAGLFFGLSSDTLEKNIHLTPNQGIHRSAINGMISGLSLWLLFVLFSGLVGGLLYGVLDGLLDGLIFGLIFGLLIGLNYGGFAYIQHGILRLLLWREKAMPLQYAHFLDYAASCILLRKVRGGYIFIHRQLLDFFASEDNTSLFTETKKTEPNIVSGTKDESVS